ncbi:MAG: hypothetical protein OQK94_06720 [Gammaproteobacteria bacterium]|nr:hypothetical protein [Gammaproteobacteria bacterium]MCW8841520.1 hypothetical protein [Gammaproteobacteria bacterium]MCW8927378.1 hypothetical protein [Gammaproteobacteria bacterium]MCW8958216.1 hypothetical protein [Gammaproteobacteria bacterium]MCW8973673.1 hypothetical protein [Gammaproteobacteria bacterium]
MKKILIVIAVAAVAIVTLPLWGSCDLNAKVCSGWCEVRHFNAELKAAGCRARCSTDRLRCLAGGGSDSVEEFMEGYRGK